MTIVNRAYNSVSTDYTIIVLFSQADTRYPVKFYCVLSKSSIMLSGLRMNNFKVWSVIIR